ncbi:hypothetical protein THAOC_24915 [Thalassiosira oceanica]|uniref:Methyltransferase type 12 domain-containing protein n=1 Tax=Thalassiosira oceanica TaxID=159749 RepID=K0RSM7_THAOC|nr:hypothetical protein THAOC_24915 [Thalassiosira oceanica]|eukprot:EJK55359.1 hypothetical protein THAOC_24915 [Thalassiosira oceanica]
MGDILESPSAERNKAPIWDMVLGRSIFPKLTANADAEKRVDLKVLELAAGCGVHTEHFVMSFNKSFKDFAIEWTPSDPDMEARLSIDARAKAAGLQRYILPSNGWALGDAGGTACGDGNSRRRQNADVRGSETADFAQHLEKFDLITCINMIHISPWSATRGLMDCAGKCLRKGGMLVCYGPYKVGGTATDSNMRFDQSLRSRDPSWGVRNIEDVCAVADENGLEFVEKIEMPANNLSVVFRKN